MKREIYVVDAKVVDASGGFNNVTGYPATFDSHQNNDDLDKTNAKAYASFYGACQAGETARASGRPLTIVNLLQVSTGTQIEAKRIGKMPELPDPTFAVTVNNGEGSGTYAVGSNVSIVADEPEEGKQFAAWEGAEGLTFISGDATSAYASFRMPAEAVTLTATYEDAPEPEPEGE